MVGFMVGNFVLRRCVEVYRRFYGWKFHFMAMCRGILSVLWLEIFFYSDASAEPLSIIYLHKTDDIPPQMKIFILNMVIPILMHFLTFIHQKHGILYQMYATSATYNHYVSQSQPILLMASGLRWYIAEYTYANS